MKILYITPLRGGIGHWSRCLIEELDKLANIIIVTYKKKRKEDENTPFLRVNDEFILEVIDPNRPYHIIEFNSKRSLDELVKFTEEIRPHCVHFVMWAGRQILWFLKEYSKILNKKKVPLVLTLHEAYPQIVKEGDLQSFTDAYKYANHIVVLTSDASRDLKKEGITIPISIIPHGNYHAMNKNLVSTEKAREIVGDCLSIPLKGMHTVLFIGYIRDYKGLIYLIRAAPYVLKKIPNTLFIAAGSLELAEKPLLYEQEIKRLGLEDKFIIYAKFIEDYLLFESFYKCADVVVYPYVGVSQSGTMLTAVGMKRPVIFSRLGSFIKKLEEQGVIMTFKPRDPKSLAEKIEYLLTHEEERKRMAENAYHVLERDYSWKRIASNYMEVFKRTS